jgi:lipocalin-like protein
MTKLPSRTCAAAVLLSLGVGLPTMDAVGQQKSLGEQILGAWTYVAVDTVRPDGSRTPMYGPDPQGMVIFDASGHYALVNARADQPKFASNNRLDGTPEEYKAIVQGSIAHFGRYTVNEADKTITFHIETSTFPNWNGIEQKRPFTLNGDDLKWTTPSASGGGSGEVVLKRAK